MLGTGQVAIVMVRPGMNGKRWTYALAVAALALAVGACAAQPPGVQAPAISHAELLRGDRLGISRDAAPPPVSLTAVNEDMRAFLRQHVPAGLGPTRTIELILQALLQDGLQLRYDNFRTFTAEEAFYQREGNCMSFTNLFVALAREAGVNARYQEVEIPPSWTADGDTWRYNLHINALVKLPVGEQVVDFNLEDYDRDYKRRLLSDEDA
ncbi:MAG: transglutaminase domain-containing protein, partial [Pseudomonadales bacterium]